MQEEKQGVADEFPKVTGSFIKGADFDGEGLTLTVVSMKKFTPEDEKYGVANIYGPGGVMTSQNFFVKNNILEEGQSLRYTFEDEGVEKTFENKSAGFYFAFTNLNPSSGDVVIIKRNKKSDKEVDWTIKKV